MLRRLLCLSTAVAFVTLAMAASPAYAQSPWWHLVSSAAPTDLQPGVAEGTLFTLSYEATEGEFLLAASEETLFGAHRLLAWNASPAAVQTALQELYPANKVEVSGEPGAYHITFPGQPDGVYGYAKSPVSRLAPAVNASPFFVEFFGGTPLEINREGVKEPVEPVMAETSKGRPDGQVVVVATNLGDAEANGETTSPISLQATLPPGLEAVGVLGSVRMWTGQVVPVECTLKKSGEVTNPTCTFKTGVLPYNSVALVISVVDTGANSGEAVEAAVSGGGARSATLSRPIVAGATTPFGVTSYELSNEDATGAPETQAGSHPFQQTTSLVMNQSVNVRNGVPEPAALPKDLRIKWPPGLIGNPTTVPQCPLARFLVDSCPPETAVGVANLLVTQTGPIGGQLEVTNDVQPVFNLVPSPGEPARLAFKPVKPVYIDPSVRSGEDYGVTVNSENITQVAGVLSVQVTVWGVPGAAIHDDFRGLACLNASQGVPGASCEPAKVEQPAAFLSLPTACTGPLQSEIFGDAWVDPKPAAEQPLLATAQMPALDGCNAVPFRPELHVAPDGTEASKPTGLNVDLHVSQDESENPSGLAVSAARNITVALPEGVSINPASAGGLEACSEQLVGFEGFREMQPGFSPPTFTPRVPGSPSSEQALEPGKNFCPDASKIGTVKIKTPILRNPIEGAVYLAAQDANPFGSLIAMYVIAEDPVSGTVVKLAGQVHLSPSGQIVTTFEDSPQAPFEDAEFHFFSGERAPLTTPARCGVYTATGSVTPWSGNTAVQVSSSFAITSGPHGSACPGQALPFAPTMTAQSTSIDAGGFSPLVTTIGREDGGQDIQQAQVRFPPGLSGILAGVKLCSDQQANDGTCGPESQIGESTASVGVGAAPYTVTGGRVYITEKYEGSPFGVSIVTPAIAGPFNLGTVVVRGKLDVDPHTAALTFTSNTVAQGHAIPRILDGIPLQIRQVNVTVNRPGFAFNPTNCNPMKVEGTIVGGEGASSLLQVPFQVTNCATLKFAPKFEVSTSGRTSKLNGTNLHVRLSYPKGAFGTQANIASVKVELPIQLPSRLSTLNEACIAATFDRNPAECPTHSIVGHAKATTPVLPVPLEGPAYFVSHGGEAFPSLTIVLKGYGVTVQLVGDTFISKRGITSSTFRTAPDVPFSTFDLELPKGPFSALGANGNLCKAASRLNMPTAFKAQNGMAFNRVTKVKVTGCPRNRQAHGKHGKKAGRKRATGQHGGREAARGRSGLHK